MQHDLELGYIGIEVEEAADLAEFFGEIIGLTDGAATPSGESTWRNDDKAQRIVVETGPANDASYIGVEAVDADAFAVAANRIRRAGFEIVVGSDDEKAQRRVADLAHGAITRCPDLPGFLLAGHLYNL